MKLGIVGLMLGLGCIVLGAAANGNPLTWRPLVIKGNQVRWERPADPRMTLVLTWQIADSEQTFADALNCRHMISPREMLAASRIDEATLRAELVAAFAMWQQVADITFVEALPGAKPNIVIGAQRDPVGRAFADVAYDQTGGGSLRAIKRSLVCLNPRLEWKVGFDGNLKVYDLRYTLAHEIGHAIGLDHSHERGSLMWFSYDERSRQLQSGDVEGAMALYGPARQRVQLSKSASAN